MKTLLSLAVLGSLVSGSAYARYIGPNLVREFRTGHTLPEFTRSETCSIYEGRVVKNVIKSDGVEQTIEKNIFFPLSSADVWTLARRVERVKLVTEQGPVDGPRALYKAVYLLPTDAVKTVELGFDNGDVGEFRTRNSPDVRLLRSFMDAVCDAE